MFRQLVSSSCAWNSRWRGIQSIGRRFTSTNVPPDEGEGNLGSIENAEEGLGEKVIFSSGLEEADGAQKYMPGVTSLTEDQMFPLWTPGRKQTRKSVRTGLIAVKVGNIGLWDVNNKRFNCSVLCVDRCHVTAVEKPQLNSKTGHWHLEVSAGLERPYKVRRAQRYHFATAGVEPKRKTCGFGVTEDALLPPGTELTARHFVAGQHVDVQGVTRGKGFQGAVRRWGFKGQGRTHGVTKAARSLGSTGTRAIKTKPGRKMAGRMGGKRKTIQKFQVYKVDGINNLIYIRGGAVPGAAGNFVFVRDARFLRHREADMYPFPTRFTTGKEVADDLVQTADGVNRHAKEATLYFHRSTHRR
ncbi:hypothetical protein NDN08_001494 [Rhodosorus marinus]|uniref:Large ribosomal subunit protein uL3m n=1 Tax=Rhodosorus marinus TaxID=101924 RepID=A0AAV8UUP6_9RHOD|nr:hypothetical protein NDN08_001494 [Rhodosorus marinus]